MVLAKEELAERLYKM